MGKSGAERQRDLQAKRKQALADLTAIREQAAAILARIIPQDKIVRAALRTGRVDKATADYEELWGYIDALRRLVIDGTATVSNVAPGPGTRHDEQQDLADCVTRLVGLVAEQAPMTLATWADEMSQLDGDRNRLAGGVAALRSLWDYGADGVEHCIAQARQQQAAQAPEIANGRREAVTDDEIMAAIAGHIAAQGKAPSISGLRKALSGRPVGELRLRRAVAKAQAERQP